MGVERPGVARVRVPLLIGMTVREARTVGHSSGVVVTSADVDGPPLGALTWPGTWIVIAQSPVPGSLVARWSTVAIEFEERPDGGGAGDREPRTPLPEPPAMRAERDEQGERDEPDEQGEPGEDRRQVR